MWPKRRTACAAVRVYKGRACERSGQGHPPRAPLVHRAKLPRHPLRHSASATAKGRLHARTAASRLSDARNHHPDARVRARPGRRRGPERSAGAQCTSAGAGRFRRPVRHRSRMARRLSCESGHDERRAHLCAVVRPAGARPGPARAGAAPGGIRVQRRLPHAAQDPRLREHRDAAALRDAVRPRRQPVHRTPRTASGRRTRWSAAVSACSSASIP